MVRRIAAERSCCRPLSCERILWPLRCNGKPDAPPLFPSRALPSWLAIVAGEEDAYDGEAINPKHLSLIERLMGVGECWLPLWH